MLFALRSTSDDIMGSQGLRLPVSLIQGGFSRYPSVRLSDSPVEIKPAPLHGEHTAQVLMHLAGCTPEDIERLREAGAV
jgi:hypothetical protein